MAHGADSKKITKETALINLGWSEEGEAITMRLRQFLETRALIQASSGGGKSWLLRLILEQTMRAGIPVWLIDPEGEYTSLREQFDIVIFGDDGGDLPVDAETLRAVLPELLKKSVSCVFDLSECKQDSAVEAIRAVGDALMEAPKSDWKPLLFAVDEAQKLAPQGKSNPAMEAVADIASRGRKRGFGSIVATQQLSALDKKITTQLLNRFFGGCVEDIEINRAAGYIGKKNAAELLNLNAGDFFALGSAFDQKESVRFRAGDIETSHPNSAAQESLAVVPPAGNALGEIIKGLREKINQPAEADEAENEIESKSSDGKMELEYKRQLRELNLQLIEERRKASIIPPEVLDAIRRAAEEYRISEEKNRALMIEQLNNVRETFESNFKANRAKLEETLHSTNFESVNAAFRQMNDPKAAAVEKTSTKPKPAVQPAAVSHPLSNPQQKILDVLALFKSLGLGSADRSNVAVFAGVSPNSGAFKNNLGVLRNEAGKHRHPPLIEYRAGGRLALTRDGSNVARDDLRVSSNEDLHAAWFRHLRSSKKQAILEELIKIYPDQMSKKDLARITGQSENSGAYKNNLGNLRSIGLIDYGDYQGEKTARATDLLFPFV